MQGIKDYQEKLFLSFRLSERVPKENFYRRLKETLDLSYLRKMTAHYYGTEGQKSIDTEVFFKFMLIGYLENINSDRKIIENAQMRLDMLYFLGYDIDEPLPWHSTLSRTRQLFGEGIFLELFRNILKMCIDKGMVNGTRQAIDSAYIKSNASMESLVEKDTSDYFNILTDNEEIKKELSNKSRKRNTKVSNADFVSTTDSDARISKKSNKAPALNYSGQISVDTASHVICGAMADFADKKDSQSLSDIVEQTCENLKPADIHLKEVLADTNYSSGEALRYLENKDIDGYIPNFGLYKHTHEGFTYCSEEDYYLCHQGVKLPFKGIRKRSGCDKQVKQYRSLKKDCADCSFKAACADKNGIKKIEDTVDKPYYERMHKKVHSGKGRKMKKIRSATVEPVLGTLLEYQAMRKVYTKGIQLANKHILLACTAYNLKKLMRFKNIKSAANAIKSIAADLKLTVSCKILLFYELMLFGLNDKKLKPNMIIVNQ